VTTLRSTVLGIPLDDVTPAEAVQQLHTLLRGGGQHHVATPNNEILVAATHLPDLATILQRTSLNLPDSTGVAWAMRRQGAHLRERVTGVDTVARLCAELTADTPVFLLGAANGVARAAGETLTQHNPQLRIVGTHAGSPRSEDAPGILERIRTAAPHLLLVAFGCPAQERWIATYLPELPSVRVAMGVGGTFDFLAGRVPRAPRVCQQLGLEWLWRLTQQPSRWRRILTATVIFPWLVLRHDR
jgi:N-acetylglucosaminyldiphosphoundecaprenol N-acetyl-beta-D-mannosaminyltransferase